jgi:hypothetical protein
MSTPLETLLHKDLTAFLYHFKPQINILKKYLLTTDYTGDTDLKVERGFRACAKSKKSLVICQLFP